MWLKEERLNVRMSLVEELNKKRFMQKDSIADIVPYLLEDIPYGLAVNSSSELRMCIAAAIFKYKSPEENYEDILASMDSESYSDETSISEIDTIGFLLTGAIELSVNMLNHLMEVIKTKQGKYSCGEFYFFSSMSRIKDSFASSIILLKNGFFVEVIPVFRLIYEQLCWACYVLDEKDIEKIKKNSTTKNTKYLKEKINPEYGKIYDYLSKEAHLDPKVIGKYFECEEESIIVKGRSGQKCREEIDNIILLYKMFIEVIKYSVNQHFGLEDTDKEHYNELIDAQLLMCEYAMKSCCNNIFKFEFINTAKL